MKRIILLALVCLVARFAHAQDLYFLADYMVAKDGDTINILHHPNIEVRVVSEGYEIRQNGSVLAKSTDARWNSEGRNHYSSYLDGEVALVDLEENWFVLQWEKKIIYLYKTIPENFTIIVK